MTIREAPLMRLQMTYDEYRRWATEDVLAEWIDGEVFVHMPPKEIHQRMVKFLERLLDLFVRLFDLGLVRIAPFEMRIGGNAFEPDVFVLKRENCHRLTDERLDGPADLVIEIVSQGSVGHDRDVKFRAYEAAAIPEYWIIDSRPDHRRADFYRLDEHGMYRLFATEDDEQVRSTVLTGFWFKPAWLWMDDAPAPLDALYEMAGVPGDLAAQVQAALRKGLQPDA
ncbi:MAG: Uma2 family endonuclease [Chloroflexi bacterium]|nr:Uma2 family endonuclease [Chloroflexota bacterium]